MAAKWGTATLSDRVGIRSLSATIAGNGSRARGDTARLADTYRNRFVAQVL
jgi:hypothetical protein